MNFFHHFEMLSFLGLVVVLFIISYLIFTNKRYNNFKKRNDTPQITFLVEFFLITLLFCVSILSLLAIFTVYINSVIIGIFVLGLIIGVVLVKETCRYYVHDGLIVLGTVTTLGVILVLLIQDNPFENKWAVFMLGIAGSLLMLPLYGRVLITYAKKTTIVTTIVLISVLFMFVIIQETLIPSSTEKIHYLYYIIFGVLYISGSLYLFLDYKHMLTWFIWLVIEWVIKLRYKIIYEGVEHLSDESGLLILSNHMSWIDWIVVQFPVKRRIHYMINKNYYYKWYFNPFVRLNECIPISKHASNQGFRQARKLLKTKHVIGMFPEGSISKKGVLGRFNPGFELLNGSSNAKIVPMYIDGLWGSVFSRSHKKFCSEKSGFRRVIRIRFGSLLPLPQKALEVKQTIKKMQDENI